MKKGLPHMKNILVFLLVIISHITYAETLTYETSFRGIKVGASTLPEIIEEHGEPLAQVVNSNNVKYMYRSFHVTIQDSTGKVNTIIILDTNYTDLNGISVGDRRSMIEIKLRQKQRKNYLVDIDNGIIYWFRNDKVSKIVLAHRLQKANKQIKSDRANARPFI